MVNKEVVKNLENVVRIKSPQDLNFEKILQAIEVIKDYKISFMEKPYECEWLESIQINLENLEEQSITDENLPPNLNIGNIQTYNYKKVPRII